MGTVFWESVQCSRLTIQLKVPAPANSPTQSKGELAPTQSTITCTIGDKSNTVPKIIKK